MPPDRIDHLLLRGLAGYQSAGATVTSPYMRQPVIGEAASPQLIREGERLRIDRYQSAPSSLAQRGLEGVGVSGVDWCGRSAPAAGGGTQPRRRREEVEQARGRKRVGSTPLQGLPRRHR